jgi:hypothetical protein
MPFPDLSILLFALKWVFIGLVYLALFLVVVAVRREMSLRIGPVQAASAPLPGRLRVISPGNDPRLRAGAILSLKPETHLGADPGNDLVLSDTYVSRRHARLHWDGSTWWVADLNSSNGTFVNQRRCLPGNAQPLAPGAILQLGEMTFELLD